MCVYFVLMYIINKIIYLYVNEAAMNYNRNAVVMSSRLLMC